MEVTETQIINYKKSKSLESLENFYVKPSFLELLGIDRKEVVHTNFLAWLFRLGADENNVHPLQLFLNYFFYESNKQLEPLKHVTFDNITEIKILTEKGSKDRFDLVIEFKRDEIKTTVIIENKVHSNEHNKQTDRYAKHGENNSNIHFGYLTPTTNNKLIRDNFIEINKNFVLLNYQGLLDYVLTKLNYADNQINLFIKEYILTLSKSWTLHLKKKTIQRYGIYN